MFAHGEADAGSAQMSAEHESSVAMVPGVTAQRYCSASSEGMLCSGPMPYCACVHTSKD